MHSFVQLCMKITSLHHSLLDRFLSVRYSGAQWYIHYTYRIWIISWARKSLDPITVCGTGFRVCAVRVCLPGAAHCSTDHGLSMAPEILIKIDSYPDQHWLAWTNIDLSSTWFCGLHLRPISQELPKIPILLTRAVVDNATKEKISNELHITFHVVLSQLPGPECNLLWCHHQNLNKGPSQ